MSRVPFCHVALLFIYISKTTDKIRDSPVHSYSIGVHQSPALICTVLHWSLVPKSTVIPPLFEQKHGKRL